MINPYIEPTRTFKLVRDSFISISKALELLESSAEKSDSSKVHHRIFCLDVIDKYGLYKLNKVLYKREKIFDNSLNLDEIDKSFQIYFDYTLEHEQYEGEQYGILAKTIFKTCFDCSEKTNCVEIFAARILPIFMPNVVEKNLVIKNLYNKYCTDIIAFIHKNAISNNDDSCYGWRDNIQKDRVADALIIAEFLNYIYRWHKSNSNCKLELMEKYSYNGLFFNKCIETIKDLQIANIEKSIDNLKSAGISEQNTKISPHLKVREGGWFGKYVNDVWKIKIRDSAKIAIILNTIYQDSNNKICKEVIKNTEKLLRSNFDGGNFLIDYTHGPDYAPHDPNYKYLKYTDISGTIEATNFYVELESFVDIQDVFISNKIQWIINQQLPSGAWPIISKIFHSTQYPDEKLLSEKENISINNTVQAISLLTNYLVRLLYDDDEKKSKY